jgi:hypothetical protein
MEDRIGVGKYAVKVARAHPELEKLVLQRLDVMQRELQHVHYAIARLKALLPNRSTSTTPLAHAVMDSRNWVVSVVMSHAFVQAMMAGDTPPSRDQVEKLAARAASLGEQDGAQTLMLAKPGMAAALKLMDQYNSLNPPSISSP